MLTIQNSDLHEDRFSRLRLIPWWDQSKLAACKVLVIGAGALGNEILKNLVLLGFQRIVVVDSDRIDESNLSRTILYRSEDVGEFKVKVAARACESISPHAVVQPIVANVLRDCGLGLFRWCDIVLAGLDNREARLFLNRSSWKVNRPWIDGAIEGINGVARVFLPGAPPCYECTLGEVDWAILERRMSCNLLAHEEITEGKVPTTPTISSIIAGIQVQEAVKLLHGLPTLSGHGYVFEGLHHSSYRVEYTENSDCMSHYTLPEIVPLPEKSDDLSLEQLWQRAARDLGSDQVVIEFSRDIIHKLGCRSCGQEQEVFAPVGSVSSEAGRCPSDGQMRVVHAIHGYDGSQTFGNRKLTQLGLPQFDIFTARSAGREIGYLLNGDAETILGPLAKEGG
ncbi:MAG TPA: ThiF family adenylyltransferase [Candidatus Dormibacteraeota bacterium]|jgi:molybdopterin/thiamine biosynthesis adenylyltransferase|nr:ThiF family adenylyltransferase [Candidatus Dormibacteraeota bacterium]